MAQARIALLLLLSCMLAANTEGCLTRKQCNATRGEICMNTVVNLNLTEAQGTCVACGRLKESECYPPCLQSSAGNCTKSKLDFDLDLDLKAPYYFQVASAVTKPTVQMLLFPPKERPSLKMHTKLMQLGFVGIAVVNAVLDAGIHYHIFFINEGTRMEKLTEWAVEMISSSNMVAAAAALGTTLGVLKNQEQRMGNIFVCYFWFLLVLYLCPSVVLFLAAIPGMIAYFWASIIWLIILSWLCNITSRSVKRAVVWLHGSGGMAESLLKTEHEDSNDFMLSFDEAENDELFQVFFLPLYIPFVAFMITVQARLFGGDGYMNSFWLTIMERHIATYVNGIRASAINMFHAVSLIF